MAAGKTITDLRADNPGTTLTGTELIELEQNGVSCGKPISEMTTLFSAAVVAAAENAIEAAASAEESAGVAQGAEAVATTKAGEASASAGDAAGSAITATTYAGISEGYAGEAGASAVTAAAQAGIATTKAGEASTSAGAATTQAGIATTKAGEAAASAAVFPVMHPEGAYYARMSAVSGAACFDRGLLLKWFGEYLKNLPNIYAAWFPELGMVERTSTVNRYAKTVFDLQTGNYDMTQATDATQPFVAGYVNPKSRRGIKYVKNQTQTGLLNFTSKAFSAADSWTFTVVLKPNSANAGASQSSIWLSSTHNIGLTNAAITLGTNSTDCLKISQGVRIGVTNIIEFQYSNGVGLIKLNGIPYATTTNSMAVTFDRLFSATSTYQFDGTIYGLTLSTTRATEYESQTNYSILRAIFPEIEGVDIGYQHWAATNYEAIVDGAGNTIAESQGASTDVNPELTPTTRNYESGIFGVFDNPVGGATAAYTLNTVSPISGSQDGKMVVSVVGTSGTKPSIQYDCTQASVIGKSYRIKFDYKLNSGTCICMPRFGTANSISTSLTGTGTYIGYVTATSANVAGYIQFDGRNLFDVQVDNFSIQEVGWADSTTLYDYTVLNTTGTAIAKDYAGIKAAAMWCHYNNDPVTGAWAGKLYNWFAAKLISLNPPMGWRVPTKADCDQLILKLGGSTTAGGRMKLLGTTYLSSQSAGTSNDSGFSAIGAGNRSSTGVFGGLKSAIKFWTSEQSNASQAKMMYLADSVDSANVYVSELIKDGYSIRLMRNAPTTPDNITMPTGRFTTDVSSSAKVTEIPFGYRVKEIRVATDAALTSVSVDIYDYANTSLVVNAITGKAVAAGAETIFAVVGADVPVPYQNRNLRFKATGNSGSGINVTYVLEKIMSVNML